MNNYQRGYSFEAEIVKKTRELESVILAERFHKSVGPVWKLDYENLNRFGNYKPKYAPVDSWHLDKNGRMTFSQMKRGVLISTCEMLDLVLFAMDLCGIADVCLITKSKKKVHVWKLQPNFI